MKSVLVIEDEVIQRFQYSQMLRGVFDLHFAPDGESALQLLSARDYDVIIFDFNLPGITGIETFNRMKKSGWNPKARCVLVTAYGSLAAAEGAEAEYFLKVGFDMYIDKASFNKISLLSALIASTDSEIA